MGIPRPLEVEESAKRARRSSPRAATTTRSGAANERTRGGRARPPPVIELFNGEPLEFEMDMDPGMEGDLALDLPRIFLNTLSRRSGSGSRSEQSRMRDVQRVLQEAERVMGRPTGTQRRREGREEQAERGEQQARAQGERATARPRRTRETPATADPPARAEQRAPVLERRMSVPLNQPLNASLNQPSGQAMDPTVPRYTSLPEDVQAMCSRAVTRITCLMRAVESRAMEGFALPEEVHRMYQIVEIILGLRSGFAESGSDEVGARTGRHPITLSSREMETILMNSHHDNPQWRQEDDPDLTLQKFHSCIEDGDLVQMLQLIPRMRHPIYHRDMSGETALHVACLYGREEEAQLLLDMGHYADPCCHDGSTPLADAASGGFANLVTLLAMRTPHQVNMVDVDGDGPLHNAARGDHADVVRVLLEAGADTTLVNRDGERPIDLAVENSRCFRLLSTRLAAVNGRDREVLRLFSLYSAHDTENEGFTIVDLLSLSNGRLGPDHVVGAVHRLTALGVLEQRGLGDTHWALADSALLAERGLTYE